MALQGSISPPAKLSGRYLNKRELAAYYGVSVRWIEYQVARGMPSRLIGRQRRFLIQEVDKWLEEPPPVPGEELG